MRYRCFVSARLGCDTGKVREVPSEKLPLSVCSSWLLPHHPFEVDFQVLDVSVLHAQRDAGGAVEPSCRRTTQQFGKLFLSLQGLGGGCRWFTSCSCHTSQHSKRSRDFYNDFWPFYRCFWPAKATSCLTRFVATCHSASESISATNFAFRARGGSAVPARSRALIGGSTFAATPADSRTPSASRGLRGVRRALPTWAE
ncbi:hypothetical protein Pan181_05010 [Aeoliella mucimassa]|uniref:Uncharacterized protein n=1 Tax=Aeoliella mucimassa TaxID=2527972 RepID=A0A518AHX1_9BACT|nr:hypothetical protein Pan181_05010 [Aeoliella mucimassa]